MSLHRFVRGKTTWQCTVEVGGDTLFGIWCRKPAVKGCYLVHEGNFDECGEARCREHDRGSKAKKGAKRK